LIALTPIQNLTARGEHQKPSAGGSGGVENAGSSGYDNANHNVLGNPMDPAGDSATDFAYGPPGGGEY
jgi:hypothetical protein